MGGRTSATVTKHVRARMKTLADRIHQILVAADLIPADTDPRTMLVAVEMADRVLSCPFATAPSPARGTPPNSIRTSSTSAGAPQRFRFRPPRRRPT